ncbi:replication initiation and membrane attachment family protein [Limosilactobacillus albertensis]|uniref:DnaD domain protein n=1 Tax=Limosilactobacillus albertensis TaxID=2759752 RepID=A0A839H7S9_9LACO|nr:DnaD domain protein [Limosilactobacillus albertensis]MBB1122647.1 DnaD domain protein [Limosilactobacillus albertensis]MCD7122935.1 DnaD domain protein [Limosilactobacillus albertensis]
MTATTFDPQAGYIVTASTAFVNFNDQTFATFYQPILGPVAFSLFYTFRARLIPKPTISNRTMQSELLAHINAGGQQVIEALHRLEAVGLVQTYFQSDEVGDVYVYELQPTLTPEKFLTDNLLSILLLEEIGETAFNHLIEQSRQYKLASSNVNLTNISHRFFEEFHINSQSITATPKAITDARKQSPIEKQPSLTAGMKTDFNWSTLLHLLANQPIVSSDLENSHELILLEHQLYGIDEPTMKKLVLRSIDLQTNHFNPQKFKQIVASTYNVIYTQPSKVAEQKSPVANDGLTSRDRQLLKTAADYSPVEFLQDLKAQTGGYVTSGERHILTGLVEQEKLTKEAINILTWYVIGDRGHSTLTANFVDTIANNWLQNGVSTGQQALLQLKNFNKQAQEKKKEAKKPHRNNWRKAIKEPMPEWSKKDKSELMKKASSQEVAKLRERIANRKKK